MAIFTHQTLKTHNDKVNNMFLDIFANSIKNQNWNLSFTKISKYTDDLLFFYSSHQSSWDTLGGPDLNIGNHSFRPNNHHQTFLNCV